jgi:hypothetical protein
VSREAIGNARVCVCVCVCAFASAFGTTYEMGKRSVRKRLGRQRSGMLSLSRSRLSHFIFEVGPTDRPSFICRKAFYPIQKVTSVVSLPIERCLLPPTAFFLYQKETWATKRRVLFCQAFHYRCQSNTQFSRDLDGIQEHFEIEFHCDINWCIIHIVDLWHVFSAPSMKRFPFEDDKKWTKLSDDS